jgi:hypothetical protein
MNQNWWFVTCIDIFQDALLRVVLCPKNRGVAIVSKTTDKGFIQPLNGRAGGCAEPSGETTTFACATA